MILQEDIERQSIVLSKQAAKMTAQTLAKLMRAALRKIKQKNGELKPGRQSFKQLSKGGPLASIPITDDNIKAFDPVARKYGVSYDLKQDASVAPPRWLIVSTQVKWQKFASKMAKNFRLFFI